MTQQEKIENILRQMFINTGLKLTEIGWETTEEEIQETASQIERLITEATPEFARPGGHIPYTTIEGVNYVRLDWLEAQLQASLKGKS